MRTVTIEETKKMEDIIGQCPICFVGMTDLDGNPYVLPMNFGYQAGTLYLHSGPEGGKLGMLAKNSRVCVTFCAGHELTYQSPQMACSYSMRSASVMCRGEVEFVEDLEDKRRYLDLIMRHYTDNEFGYSDPAVRNVKVWKVAVQEMSGKVFGLRGHEKI
ncbi:MAG: pyridoxamine 5'-phosphate oxidase family protein [Bacteroidia bacterium]|nr:pyridoxamine 5'-phosphate oxidase family protein [Bacteroidia bacterium]